ncbi:MAG: hypothetical protein M3O71_22720 [Bacteroidota bacterium]|nr:hypothetical protein [Bacteroidota bacterium]
MKQALICILVVIVLTSCGQSDKQTAKKDTIKKDGASSKTIVNPKENDTLAIPDDTIPKITIPEGSIQVAEEHVDTSSKMRILSCADYNEQDGVGPGASKLNWKGLFYKKYDKNRFYIKSTKLKFTRVHSEMDEEENQKTGWRIKCDNNDNNIILITGANDIVDRPVKKALLSTDLYYAGQKMEFIYYGVKYTLYTTGRKTNGLIYNYKLFLMANVKGHNFNQLLISVPPGDSMGPNGDMAEDIDIEFAGDLDGDQIPDFIIEKSGYSFGDLNLYLSKAAGDKSILKLVSVFGTSD